MITKSSFEHNTEIQCHLKYSLIALLVQLSLKSLLTLMVQVIWPTIDSLTMTSTFPFVSLSILLTPCRDKIPIMFWQLCTQLSATRNCLCIFS